MSSMFSFDEKNIYYHILYNLIKNYFFYLKKLAASSQI